MSPNRIVAVLTPLVFAPLAGTIAAFVAHNFPGVEISEGSLTQIFIAGALIALAKAAQWTRGWQMYEERQEASPQDLSAQDPFELPPLGDFPPAPPELDPESLLPADDELDALMVR
jgi:hypothetical protein